MAGLEAGLEEGLWETAGLVVRAGCLCGLVASLLLWLRLVELVAVAAVLFSRWRRRCLREDEAGLADEEAGEEAELEVAAEG